MVPSATCALRDRYIIDSLHWRSVHWRNLFHEISYIYIFSEPEFIPEERKEKEDNDEKEENKEKTEKEEKTEKYENKEEENTTKKYEPVKNQESSFLLFFINLNYFGFKGY